MCIISCKVCKHNYVQESSSLHSDSYRAGREGEEEVREVVEEGNFGFHFQS